MYEVGWSKNPASGNADGQEVFQYKVAFQPEQTFIRAATTPRGTTWAIVRGCESEAFRYPTAQEALEALKS